MTEKSADALDGEVYHYRDKNGLECDAVVHLRNGRYGLVEVKLGGDRLINEGAENLITLAGKIKKEGVHTIFRCTPSLCNVYVNDEQWLFKPVFSPTECVGIAYV